MYDELIIGLIESIIITKNNKVDNETLLETYEKVLKELTDIPLIEQIKEEIKKDLHIGEENADTN